MTRTRRAFLASNLGMAAAALLPGCSVRSMAVNKIGDALAETGSNFAADEDPENALKYVPFPVCLPGDTGVVWLLARRENLTPVEGAIALAKVEEDFWASKTGQKLLRDRVERTFPEFVARVPAGMLAEAGLKRHYKEPEPVKALRKAPSR